MVYRGRRLTASIPCACIACGHVEIVPPSNRAPDSAASRICRSIAETAINRAVRETYGDHLAILNRVVTVIGNPDIDAIIENQRRGVTNLLVQLCCTCRGGPGN